MNISANRVVAKMEEQLALLRTAVKQNDQQAVREYTSVIEGYCQLLKDQPSINQTGKVASPRVEPQPIPPQPVTPIQPASPSPTSDQKPGSLFDF
ncbi:YwdI family protein [Alkalicoccobacillus gibsonii]|uniref:YwdI family protein n=1 Tax=Alkalicoccobacillus gibsonii TaxID=79881 RepID=UPI003F7C9B4A